MPIGSALRYWLPAALWTAAIFAASSDYLSAVHTAPWLATLVSSIFGHSLPTPQFETLHFLIRKAGHLTEYSILGGLLLRAVRGGDPLAWKIRWSLVAVALAAVVGSFDEWHQSFVPSRTASPLDVVIDTIGAILAQVIIRAAQVLFFTP